MEQSLQYIIIFIGVVGFTTLIGWIKKKIQFDNKDEQMFRAVLETISFIVEEFDINNKGEVVYVINACYTALDFINDMEGIDNLYDKKKLIMAQTLSICQKKGVNLNDNLIIEVIDRVSDYIIAQEFVALQPNHHKK